MRPPAEVPRRAAVVAVPTPQASGPESGFPIVGIGASAGGLEALGEFLQAVSERSGIAYVIVQHLDPNPKDMLVELLARSAAIPVVRAVDRMRVEMDHVYVIPPNTDMSLVDGALHLLPRVPHSPNLPIDFFLRSLAEDQQEHSIGVILSGMGSDGTLGLSAIKEKGGATFVQSERSAKFDGMPRSAIEAGVADVIAPVGELPARIAAYCEHTPYIAHPAAPIEDKAHTSLDKIFALLRQHTGNDFSLYKRSTIQRRIERRMGLHQIDGIASYTRMLRENPQEIELLFKELLIGVTNFFRDPAEWETLKRDVLPALIAARSSSGVVRAWVAGCSTGEEAYSLAMVFKEALDPFKTVKNITLQIFATDLDRDAIDRARVGRYGENIVADVSPERLRRFFVRDDTGFRISKEIRECVVFAPQNLIMDPPFTKVDVLSCRNLLIYLSADLQKKLIPLFHYCLNPGGVLFLGSAETIGTYTNLFTPMDGKTRLFRRLDQAPHMLPVELRATPYGLPPGAPEGRESEPAPPKTPMNLQATVDRLLVQRFAPLGVLCNDKGDVLYMSGRSGKYFEPSVGKANLNIFSMAREGLRYELATAFAAALRDGRPVQVHGVRVGTNGGSQTLDLTVQKLGEPAELRGSVIVVIKDVAEAPRPVKAKRGKTGPMSPRVSALEAELQRAREEVQTTREEMQTSQEELKSTNEELQSTNEELQSTNEELTTSKEEMQSLNEELQTVNHELQAKVDELSRSNNDMKNLLNSTDVATLFLDGDLRVRRFTTQTSRIIKLIPTDTGRPITDIASELDYRDLAEDSRDVLRTLVFKERRATSRDGRWYHVRIMPYRTLENVIDGVVITFTDASAAHALEVALQQQSSQLRQFLESMPSLVLGFRPDGTCEYVSGPWLRYTGVSEAEQLRWGWLEQLHPDDRERVRARWKELLKRRAGGDLEFRIRSASGEYHRFAARWIPIASTAGDIAMWYSSSTDVDDLRG
ncbi:MAG TPA: chemotaxis protein CheB [Kofleriaceae bacterium]|nr:chemotaxis protein CheB [Kofleriaceae bacterium]